MKTALLLLVIGYNIYLCTGPAPAASPHVATTEAVHLVNPYSLIREGEPLLQEGDLVVRMNNDPMSFYIKNFNRKDPRYSHAGIVLMENGKPVIFHIVNGSVNADDKMKKDSLGAFADPRQNSAYGIFRYKLAAGEINKLKEKIQQWYKQGVSFDPAFNLQSDDKMYCSEMVRKALDFSTHGRIAIAATALTDREALLFGAYAHLKAEKMKGMQVVAIDDLYVNGNCGKVRVFKF